MVLKAVEVDEVAKGGRIHPEKLQYLDAEERRHNQETRKERSQDITRKLGRRKTIKTEWDILGVKSIWISFLVVARKSS